MKLLFCGHWNQKRRSYQELDIVCFYKVDALFTFELRFEGNRSLYGHCLAWLRRSITLFSTGLDWSTDWRWTPGVCVERHNSQDTFVILKLILSFPLTEINYWFKTTENQFGFGDNFFVLSSLCNFNVNNVDSVSLMGMKVHEWRKLSVCSGPKENTKVKRSYLN